MTAKPSPQKLSLAVKDLEASKEFNGNHLIGLQSTLKAQGVVLMSEADENTTGPGRFAAIDPDGNPIMVDQHV